MSISLFGDEHLFQRVSSVGSSPESGLSHSPLPAEAPVHHHSAALTERPDLRVWSKSEHITSPWRWPPNKSVLTCCLWQSLPPQPLASYQCPCILSHQRPRLGISSMPTTHLSGDLTPPSPSSQFTPPYPTPYTHTLIIDRTIVWSPPEPHQSP